MNVRIALAVAASLSAAACGGSSSSTKPVTPTPPTITSTTMHFSGTVRRDTGSGQPSTASGVDIRASVDRNGDGVVGDGEFVTTRSASDGTYALDIPVAQGDLVVVRFARSGSGSVFRTVQSAPGGSTITSATLKDLEQLDCTGLGCTAASGLVVKGLPAGTAGSARVFNPVTETAAFPGDFADSSGNLLQSGVFASFSLRDAHGDPVEHLTTTATVKMKMPRDTWPLVRDIVPGTDRIDVPLYAFDEAKGTWVREGTGYLEDENGGIPPESVASTIRAGTYTGTLYAVGEVSHFSSWNCDWPVQSHGRVGGEVGECWWNGERKPCAGATVTVRGESYTGTSTPVTVGENGAFGVDVMRSEAPGEDLDGDGVTGETSRVHVRVVWNGSVYDLGSVVMPSTATSGGSVTQDLGALVLNDAKRQQASVCTVTGTLRSVLGAPVTSGTVWAWDEEIPPEVVTSICYSGYQYTCMPFASVDPSGVFTVTVPQMGGLTLYSWGTSHPDGDPAVTEWTSGSRTLTSCPTGPVDLTMEKGSLFIDPTVSVSTNGEISWTPAVYGAAFVEVISASGSQIKWLVSMDSGGIQPPVTYGTVPLGATQSFPDAATPAALAPGDQVFVYLYGTTATGFTYWGSNTYTIP